METVALVVGGNFLGTSIKLIAAHQINNSVISLPFLGHLLSSVGISI